MKITPPHLAAIGLRVLSNHRVYYTIIESGDNTDLIYRDISYINVPLALSDPERLNFVRNTILDIMNEYGVTRAAIRISEVGGKYAPRVSQIAIERFNLEGVIQESLASCSVERFVAGRIGTLSSLAALAPKVFKKLADGEERFEHFPESENWFDLSLEERESALACFAALNL